MKSQRWNEEGRRRQTGAEEREKWIERYRGSAQTQRAFAAEHGLCLSTLRSWLYRSAEPQSRPRWIELGVGPAPITAGEWEAEVVVGEGRRIRFRGSPAQALLEWVKEALR